MTNPLRVVLDSNVFDCFLRADGSVNDELIDLTNNCIEQARMVVYTTHVQDDELAQTPDCNKRAKLFEIRARLSLTEISTSGAIWNVSRWGMSTWGNGKGPIKLEHIQKGNPKHSEDALIGATASACADVLVTGEVKKFRNKVNAQKTTLKVWTFTDFESFVKQS